MEDWEEAGLAEGDWVAAREEALQKTRGTTDNWDHYQSTILLHKKAYRKRARLISTMALQVHCANSFIGLVLEAHRRNWR